MHVLDREKKKCRASKKKTTVVQQWRQIYPNYRFTEKKTGVLCLIYIGWIFEGWKMKVHVSQL